MPDNLPNDNNSDDNVVSDATQPVSQDPTVQSEQFPSTQPVETIVSPTPEVQKPVEVSQTRTQKVLKTPTGEQPQAPIPTPQASVEPVGGKTGKDVQKGKHLETTHSLTAAADEEEEDFIEHVEEIH